MTRTRNAVAIVLASTCATGLCAWACLPSLSIDTGTSGPAVCGDGIIQPDGDGGEECDPGDGASLPAQGCTRSCKVTCSADGATEPFEDPITKHCYFELPGTSDIDGGEESCATAGGHVVRFVSEAEVDLVAQSPLSSFWVGLRETSVGSLRWLPTDPTTPEPGWTESCVGCFALASGPAFPSLVAGLLDAGPGAASCVDSTNDASAAWEESVCNETKARQTLCEREPAGTRSFPCAYGACFTVATTSKRYVLYSTTESPNSAYAICQTLGGQIVTFSTPEEREEVGYEIAHQSIVDAGDYWIGLSSDGTAWLWDDADAGMQPPPWAVDPGDASSVDAGTRAYVILQRGVHPFGVGLLTSELANVANPGETHFPLCEY